MHPRISLRKALLLLMGCVGASELKEASVTGWPVNRCSGNRTAPTWLIQLYLL